MATQKRNDDLVDLLRPDFVARDEPNYAWRAACSQFMALPGLRGFWPMSAFGSTGQAFDQSGNGRTLTYNGNPLYSYANLVPYIDFDGTGDFLTRADEAGLDILATETFIASSLQGITIGAWIYPEETSTSEAIMSKWGAVGNQSYMLSIDANDRFNFEISDDGTNLDTALSAIVTMNSWYFVVGKLDPGNSVDIYTNNVMVSQVSGRASIFNSTVFFLIGARGAGSIPFNGRVSLAFLCATQLSDAIIGALYNNTRAMFNI